MPKLPYVEIFLGYEIWVRILQQQQKCITSLKIVNSKSIKIKFYQYCIPYNVQKLSDLALCSCAVQIFLVECAYSL